MASAIVSSAIATAVASGFASFLNSWTGAAVCVGSLNVGTLVLFTGLSVGAAIALRGALPNRRFISSSTNATSCSFVTSKSIVNGVIFIFLFFLYGE